MTPTERAKLNDYITRSFRDVADADYIAARSLYRLGLSQQFLWAALQSLEKYLKAILLFNDINVKAISHNIEKAYDELSQITDITFDLPADIRTFIVYLNSHGPNRYFEKPFHTQGEELLELDRAVWFLRRYCQYLRSEVRKADGTKIQLLPLKLAEIRDAKKNPTKFKIIGGHLEKVLRQSAGSRNEIVWKNFYYGTYKKKVIKNFRLNSSSGIPTNFIHPDIFPILNSRIKFSQEVRDYFQNLPTP